MGLNPESGPSFVAAYIDDILVFSNTLEDHLKHLHLVLERLKEVNLKLQPAKCRFARKEVKYLGHILTPDGLKPNPALVSAVQGFPVPMSLKELRRFFGLASYYRRFIPRFASIAQPLHRLTCKDVSFVWTEAAASAFEELKEKLTTSPVLAYPSFDQDFVLETDASISGLGAVLAQVQSDSKLHPITYASRSLPPPEKNYSVTELETLAVVWAMSHFHYYLYGHKVKVYTNHTVVKAVLDAPNPMGKHARWWTRVYGKGIKEVQITHRAGKVNVNADALSRSPQVSPSTRENDDCVIQVAVVDSDNVKSLLQKDPIRADTLSRVDFTKEQQKDQWIREMASFLKDGKLPSSKTRARKVAAQAPHYSLVSGVLYYIDPRKRSCKRAVLPQHLQQTVMAEAHSGPFSGHFALNKLYQTLATQWYWEKMYADIESYCKNCPQCVIVSGCGRQNRPPLHPIPVQRPFQIIGVDIMDLPATQQENKHVVVFQDFFLKWPLVFLVADQKTATLVQLLTKEVNPLFGVPEAVLSDRGTNLLSHLMHDVCAILGIEKLNTTAYHPACNGMVECFNHTLKTALRKHADQFVVSGIDTSLAYYGHIVIPLTTQLERSPHFYCLELTSEHLRKLLFYLHPQ